jgi:hypothetical protein
VHFSLVSVVGFSRQFLPDCLAQTALGGLHAGASELKGPQEICPATRRAQNWLPNKTIPRPDLHRFAPESLERESKMLFHQRNKNVVAARTLDGSLIEVTIRPVHVGGFVFAMTQSPPVRIPRNQYTRRGSATSSVLPRFRRDDSLRRSFHPGIR